MNPFLKVEVNAGIFVAIGTKEKVPTIAEQMIAAIIKMIEESGNPLQSDSWVNVLLNIPSQIDVIMGQSASSTISTALDLAKLCISDNFCKQSTADFIPGIESLIAELPISQTLSLNCLSISMSKNSTILIDMATLTVEEFNVECTLTETMINYGDPKIAKSINEVFSNYTALQNTPYYVSVAPQ